MTFIPTHCLPTAPGTNQLLVPSVPGIGTFNDPGSPRRGVCVVFHGLFTSAYEGVATTFGLTDLTNPYFPSYNLTLDTYLQDDGWVTLYPSYPEDSMGINDPAGALRADFAADTTFGARYMNTCLLWWDHILAWCNLHYPGAPVWIYGGSHGGWMAMLLASLKSNQLTGAIVQVPATIWGNASEAFTGAANDYNNINVSGMELLPGCLSGTVCPTLVWYGRNDAAVGFGKTTLTAGANLSSGAFTGGTGVLSVADLAQITTFVPSPPGTANYGPAVKILTNTGFATVQPGVPSGSSGAGTYTGCLTTFGGGTAASGADCTQAHTQDIIAAASSHVTGHSSGDGHNLPLATAQAFQTWWQANVNPVCPATF